MKTLHTESAEVSGSGDKEGIAVAVCPDSGFKYASFFADVLGDEGKPTV